MTMRVPKVRYADADGVSIAYEVRGSGSRDIVRISGVFPSLLACAIDPTIGAAYDHLATFSRFIFLDRRGIGMSDPLTDGTVGPLEQQVADVVAVMNDAGSKRAAVWGAADGGQVAMLFAAMYPERTTALVLTSAFARLVPFGRLPVRSPRGGPGAVGAHGEEAVGESGQPVGHHGRGSEPTR